MAMYNLDDSIRDFAAPPQITGTIAATGHLSTKNTIVKVYDGRFKDISRRSTTPSSRPSSKARASSMSTG